MPPSLPYLSPQPSQINRAIKTENHWWNWGLRDPGLNQNTHVIPQATEAPPKLHQWNVRADMPKTSIKDVTLALKQRATRLLSPFFLDAMTYWEKPWSFCTYSVTWEKAVEEQHQHKDDRITEKYSQGLPSGQTSFVLCLQLYEWYWYHHSCHIMIFIWYHMI